MNRKTTFILHLLFSLLLVLGFISCKERVINPFEKNKGVFSVYGALDVDKNPNVIRVRNLLEPLNSDSTFPIDATVTFTNLESGASAELKDSVVSFGLNNTNNYILDEDLKLNTQYQITVERQSDGTIARSVVTTPGLTDAYYVPDAIFDCERPIDFRFDNVHPPEFIQMEVGVTYQNEEHWAQVRLFGPVKYNPILDSMVLRANLRNLLVEIFTPPLPDYPNFDPRLLIPTVRCDELDATSRFETPEFMIRYIHFGPEWAAGQPKPYGPIDIESGDVENGLGFLGAYRIGNYTIPLLPGIGLSQPVH